MAIPARILLIAVVLSCVVADVDEVFYGDYKLGDNKVNYNFLGITRDMNQPVACEASWAFAITSTMSALFNRNTPNATREVNLSPQMLISCHGEGFTCDKGDNFKVDGVLEKLKTVGVSDESCNNYRASDLHECTNYDKCSDVRNVEDIHVEPKSTALDYDEYKLKNFLRIDSTQPDEAAKIKELFNLVTSSLTKNGPVLCQINHDEGLFSYRVNKPQIYKPEGSPANTYFTWVSVVGYQKLNDKTAAFVLQAPFGDNVGYHGLVYIPASETTNAFSVLNNCYELDIDPTINRVSNPDPKITSAYASRIFGLKSVKKINSDAKKFLNQGLDLSESPKTPYEVVIASAGDETPVDWRNYQGRNLLTYVKNQHIPTYCGSCWIQSATSVLADRMNIANYKKGIVFPRIVLSTQAVINCRVAGTCYGGDSSLFFEKARNWPVPVETCQTYQAHNPTDFSCPAQSKCVLKSNTQTTALDKFNSVTVADWGRVRGVDAMKAKLADGPIVCDIMVTQPFEDYKIDGDVNIFNTNVDYLYINHSISVVGWGIKDNVQYWIGRNSWGKEWGYNGFFYIQAGVNMLGIESDCMWATPKYSSFA